MRFGVVLFDEDRATSGWASVGGSSARRISGIGNLSSDTLWWTSLSFTEFHTSGLSRHPNVRSAEYLRTTMEQIRDEVGLKTRFVNASDAAQVLSEIFYRTMTMAELMYGLREYHKEKFSDDLRDMLIPTDKSITEEVDIAAELAYQTFTKCTVGTVKGSRNVQFRIPRISHAKNILSTPVPGDQWEYIERRLLPEKKLRLNWAINHQQPILAEVVVSDVAEDVANLIAFGSGSSNRRSWVTHPELLLLSRYAKVDIESVFMFDEYTQVPTKYQPPFTTGISALSISAGLLAENYWVGLASPVVKMGGNKIYSPRSAWMRAADRAFAFAPALLAHTAGLQVRSYGIGGVMIGVARGDLARTIDVAKVAGLIPPMTAPEDAVIQGDLS